MRRRIILAMAPAVFIGSFKGALTLRTKSIEELPRAVVYV